MRRRSSQEDLERPHEREPRLVLVGRGIGRGYGSRRPSAGGDCRSDGWRLIRRFSVTNPSNLRCLGPSACRAAPTLCLPGTGRAADGGPKMSERIGGVDADRTRDLQSGILKLPVFRGPQWSAVVHSCPTQLIQVSQLRFHCRLRRWSLVACDPRGSLLARGRKEAQILPRPWLNESRRTVRAHRRATAARTSLS